ncbi:hypothetical protein [Sphingobacterium wenxiniae]|uniref:hypothetical protein n=1 Tax=Sphingobacterium wenxiniae TaxID=683125 RepID=UPI001113C28B|nr:hypothetical protein [Sphingobacterium wenxiniae]
MIFTIKSGNLAALCYFWGMENPSFQIATLHRGRYMLLLLLGVCIVTAIVSRFPWTEIAKILTVLVSLPFLLYLSIRWSRNNSSWTINADNVHVVFRNGKEEMITFKDIKYFRNLPRSGGNLLMIFLQKSRTPKRFWRNKLFQQEDQLNSLIHALKQKGVEYYYM